MLILLVEDDAIVEMMTEDMLREAGHKVICAKYGQETVELFRTEQPRPDALIVDNRLPDMLGWDVAEQCRALEPRLPVVMVSGDAFTGSRPMGRIVQVEKPYTEEMLLLGLAKAVEVA